MTKPIKDQVQELIQEIKNDKGIHKNLPGGSVIHIDRPVPFLCIYRFAEGVKKSPEASLLTAQAAYCLIQAEDLPFVEVLLAELAAILRKRFGAFLILELWRNRQEQGIQLVSTDDTNSQFLGALQKELEDFPLSIVQQVETSSHFPREQAPLLPSEVLNNETVRALGLQLGSFYQDQQSGALYPMIYRQFRQEFSTALRKFFFDFARVQTNLKVAHYHGLGRQQEDALVWKIDRELVEIGKSFDFLLLTSVVNHQEAWQEFKRSRYQQTPTFLYRLIPVDPELLKRRLYQIPIEELEDPTLSFVFRDKRKEIDRLLNMLEERNTPDFHLSSVQVFGGAEEELLQAANRILDFNTGTGALDEEEEEEQESAEPVNTEAFARMARQEIDWMREQYPSLDATVSVRKDITGLMVSSGQLLIGEGFSTTRKRAEALIQHEVGTHVLTYYNGKAQPLHQMYVGSPGYEDLQEGLAVLAEYLVGGLSLGRLRTLAGRVVAVDSMLREADFPETFRLLHKEKGFSPYTAYSIAERVYRGGGMTKDAVYLRGLLHLLKHLAQGHDLKPLLIGKIRQDYLPIIDELIQRKILKPAPILPRYFFQPESMQRLKNLNKKVDVLSLLN